MTNTVTDWEWQDECTACHPNCEGCGRMLCVSDPGDCVFFCGSTAAEKAMEDADGLVCCPKCAAGEVAA